MLLPTSYAQFSYPAPAVATNPYLQPTIPAYKPMPTVKVEQPQATSSGTKRDAAGIVKSVPTTAAAAAQSVALASFETDKKKAKDAKDKKNKNKKFIRAAGGQTWEDESLIEWDPG